MLRINSISYMPMAMKYAQKRNNSVNFKSRYVDFEDKEVVLTKEQEEKINTKAEKVLKQSKIILRDAKKEYSQVSKILRQAKAQEFCNVYDESGNLTRRIWGGKDIMRMQEFEDGEVARECEFNPETLEITNIYNNLKHKPLRTLIIGKIYKFRDGKLIRYTKNYTANCDLETIGQQFHFENDQLGKYTEGYKRTPYASLSIGASEKKQSISFNYKNRVIEYIEGYKKTHYGKEYTRYGIQMDSNGKWKKIELSE